MECSSDDQAEVFGIHHTGEAIKVTITILLALSVLLDFVCWKYRRVAVLIFYFECLWSLFDAILFAQDYATFPVTFIVTRLVALAVIFGIDARPTIITTVFTSAVTHLIVQTITHQDRYDKFGLSRTLIVVFLTVTTFWAHLRQSARQVAQIESR